jgi:hypothetical protein
MSKKGSVEHRVKNVIAEINRVHPNIEWGIQILDLENETMIKEWYSEDAS